MFGAWRAAPQTAARSIAEFLEIGLSPQVENTACSQTRVLNRKLFISIS
jgi:hypothetical protein